MSVNFDFRDKVIAITGAASGIGLETAKLLAASGANISIADVREEPLQDAVAEIEKVQKGQTLATVVDVTDAKQVNEWIKQTVDRFGKLDGAANMAGVIGVGMNKARLWELEDRDWDFVVGVNLTGVMYCMRAEIENIKDFGSIVNASSIAGVMGFTKNAPYVAAKHGIVGLTRGTAKEVGDRGVRINCVAPGLIETPMLRKAAAVRGRVMDFQYAIKRMGLASEVATLIAWLLCDGSMFISGSVQSIDGAWAC